MKKLKMIFLSILVFTGMLGAQDLSKGLDRRQMVNDKVGLLSSSQKNHLESKLVNFHNQTSTQIAIVILPDLQGYDKSDYAFQLAEELGIGQKGKDNGILILVKDKTATSRGEVFIATGYGLEGAVPDAIGKRIVDKEIIPNFKNGNYFAGLDAATNTLIGLTQGEFTADEYRKATSGTKAPYPIGFVILMVIVFSIFGRLRRARHYSAGHNVPFWIALSMLSSNRHNHSGSFGNFSSGSGSFGGFGGGGGFSGFGGGSFGGGGAGGSW